MKNLFIPPLGTVVVLAEDWTFKLFYEYRNGTLLTKLGKLSDGESVWRKREEDAFDVTFPKGSKLRVEKEKKILEEIPKPKGRMIRF